MTRKEYMEATTLDKEENRKLHREYYSQYVTEDIKKYVKGSNLSLEDNLTKWTKLGAKLTGMYLFNGVMTKMKLNGDWLTQAGIVCILKEAKRQLMEAEDE